MNKRIQELKNQCWVEKHWDKENERWIDRHVDLEKFAELIVLECIDQFCFKGAVHADSDIVIGVMNHFGVEY